MVKWKRISGKCTRNLSKPTVLTWPEVVNYFKNEENEQHQRFMVISNLITPNSHNAHKVDGWRRIHKTSRVCYNTVIKLTINHLVTNHMIATWNTHLYGFHNKEGSAVCVNIMKANSGSKGMVPLIYHSNTVMVSFMSQLLYPDVKTSQQPLGGSRAGLDVSEKTKIFCPLPGIKPSIIQPTNRVNKTIYICITLSNVYL